MKLLSLGAITPYGSKISEHCRALIEQRAPRQEDFELSFLGKTRKIVIELTLDPQVLLPVPDNVLRRMSRSALMALTCIEESKEFFKSDTKKVGIIVVTSEGPAGVSLDYMRKLVRAKYRGASPTLFAQSVHNNLASTIAMTYGFKGPTLTFVQDENPLNASLQIAELWLSEKSVDVVCLVMGNELNAHRPYMQLYAAKEKTYVIPTAREITSEAFSCFFIGSDQDFPDKPNFSLKDNLEIIKNRSEALDLALLRPEKIGVALAEHYFQKDFSA